MSRPDMRFVPIKSADQQAVLMLHKTRELLVKQRTMIVNALRGHLSEFGLIAAKGIQRVHELVAMALGEEGFPEAARQATAARQDPRGYRQRVQPSAVWQAQRRDDPKRSHPKIQDTPPAVTNFKFVAMIGTQIVGYHQGQRLNPAQNRPDI